MRFTMMFTIVRNEKHDAVNEEEYKAFTEFSHNFVEAK